MKKKARKVFLKISATIALCVAILIGLVLLPNMLYAHQTQVENLTVYHQTKLSPNLESVLSESIDLVKSSELYDEDFQMQLCLNDGSWYPNLVEKIKGQAFAHGFYNKVVLTSTINFEENYALINGRKWNLIELIAHEMLHCFQFNKYGWETRKFPVWKLEGYPEYISRKQIGQTSLIKNINEVTADPWTEFEDGTGCVTNYFKDRLLIQYLMDVKKWSYEKILRDETTKENVEKEMMTWFSQKK